MTRSGSPPEAGEGALLAGLLAAGTGVRLRGAEGTPKPLVEVAGLPLCAWAAKSLAAQGAKTIAVVLNPRSRRARELLGAIPGIQWVFLEAETSSSWESFRLLAKVLAGEPGASEFLIGAVDSLVDPRESARFSAWARSQGAEAALALSSPGHDKTPLWADLDPHSRVTRLGSLARERRWATAGLYYLRSSLARDFLPPPYAFKSLRAFLGRLCAERVVLGLPISRAVDVDEPQDLAGAEAFVKAVPWA